MTWRAIVGFRLVTADLDRALHFYGALGFAVGERSTIGRDEMALLGLEGSGQRHAMRLGPSRVDLDRYEQAGRSYPPEADAATLLFQHLALVTDDAAARWSQAHAAGGLPISRDGPVTLPRSAGGVTAVKFRDPDGHPLEFLQFPDGPDRGWHGAGLLGIDHSAIAVADPAVSRRFYGAHGLAEGEASLNEGPTQTALDGLDGVAVDVVPLLPDAPTPHLELLGYRQPVPRSLGLPATNDIAATRVVWRADRAGLVRDPDGHLHQLQP